MYRLSSDDSNSIIFPPVYLIPHHSSVPTVIKMSRNNDNENNIALNVHLTVPQTSNPGSGDGSHTPNTPEILNSIVNMQSGPFSSYATSQTGNDNPTTVDQTMLSVRTACYSMIHLANPQSPVNDNNYFHIFRPSIGPTVHSCFSKSHKTK